MKLSYLFLIATFLVSITLVIYIKTNYDILESDIISVEITVNNDVNQKALPLVYLIKGSDEKTDFKSPFWFHKKKDSTYLAELDPKSRVRKIRLYFDSPSKNLHIHEVKIISEKESKLINLNEVNTAENVSFKKNGTKYIIDKHGKYAFIELPKSYIYNSDFKNIHQLILPILVVLSLIILVVISLKSVPFKPFSVKSITLSILVFTVFLPAPIYNIALILMTALNLRNISWSAIKSNKINLIITGFFTVYLFNNLFVSQESFHQMSTIERFLPFVILGVVLPSITARKSLALFPLSAFVIGFGFLVTSIFDVFIHQNFVFLSFDLFTKYLHPVYFSYLLFFSICYIDLNYKGKQKYILELILFLFLIFSGSKMVFLFSSLVIIINLIKNKKTAFLILPLITVIILFSPLKTRFSEIIKKEDLSVLKENYINNPNDARINGLTLRIMLWREALATMSGIDYIIGKGVTDQTNSTLFKRLDNLGMKNHLNFNPHNQYIDTFWRTGIIGLLFLILIPVYCLKEGIKREDKLLIQFSIFTIVVMCSESIFGRVNGVYFFTTVILLLLNSKKVNENSHFRN
jgi:hypothetical protein|tara:strand:+ start:43730 stop:45460 length:1731 start_codon:yes stop_codon:yes gene_type:complete